MLIQTCTIIYTYVNSIWKGDKKNNRRNTIVGNAVFKICQYIRVFKERGLGGI